MTFANLSGGRDSTAMIINFLEKGGKIDYILFCDTEFEYPKMYEYLDKLEGYLKEKFNMQLTRLNSKGAMEKWAFEYPITKGEKQGKLRGIPRTIGKDFCTRETKIKPSREFILSKSKNRFKNVVLIGYTADEVKRGRVSNLDYATARYPLSEWGWNEAECEAFLRKRGIANPLYQHFQRTGCFLCPKQSLKSLFSVFSFYPKEWQIMLEWEERARKLNCDNQSFKPNISLKELEKRFKERLNLDLSDVYDEFETCFCK